MQAAACAPMHPLPDAIHESENTSFMREKSTGSVRKIRQIGRKEEDAARK
jgi:hypothetical protein